MKYTLVTETFPPEINGVARTLERLVTGVVERGHCAEVIRPRQAYEAADEGRGRGFEEIQMLGLPIPCYTGLRFGLPAYRRLKAHWRQRRPDCVHVATEGPLGVSAIFAARHLDIPVFSSFHTNFHSYGSHYGYTFLIQWVYRYLRWVHNKTLGTFAPSEDVCEDLRKAGFENVHRMARGVDTRLFRADRRSEALRARWGAVPEDPVVVYVGRIASEKNIPLLVRAVAAMREQEPRLKLVLVGDGPQRAKLEKAHPEFIFAGAQVGEALAEYYASGDLFLFPSVTETFGNVVTEAMASGLLVLAYHYAAPQKHIVSGGNGFTVPFNDEAAFLAQSLALLQQRTLWHELRAAAQVTAQDLSWDTVIDGYLKIIQDHPQ